MPRSSTLLRPIIGCSDPLDEDKPLLQLSPIWSSPRWQGQPLPVAPSVEVGRVRLPIY